MCKHADINKKTSEKKGEYREKCEDSGQNDTKDFNGIKSFRRVSFAHKIKKNNL